jgi:hypothetical protein
MPTPNQPNIKDPTKKTGQANTHAAYPGVQHNEAERALRHWVIARRIGMGTRTDEETRAFANLASVIETCRKRGRSPWPYLAEVIRQRRQGLQAPPLPLPAHN